MRRALSVVAATMFAVGGLAGTSASAATLPLCEEGDGYIPGETCEAAVAVVAECPEDGAEIAYTVAAGAAGEGTVDITWTNLPGPDVTVSNQPLTGTLIWPDGITTSAGLVFATTPETSLTVAYPCVDEESEVLAGAEDDDEDGESAVLAETGATGLPIALGGGALIVGGAAAVMVARRNRQVGLTD